MFVLLAAQTLQAQTDDFKAFRERMLSDYQDFRKGIMERYVEFLDAAWAEYETMSGRRRVTTPKPVVAPVYTPPAEPQGEKTPTVEVPQEPATPKIPSTPTVPKMPSVPKVPSTPPLGEELGGGTIRFTLYGLQLAVPAPKVEATLRSAEQQEVVHFWKQVNDSHIKPCVESLEQHAADYRLGDWCTFKMVEAYCTRWAEGNEQASRVLMQYLMLSMGYDVRLAVANGELYLMLPFNQQVYANTYLTVNNTKYYLYPKNLPSGSRIYSCAVPADVDCGRGMDLIVNPAYRLPRSNQPFALSHGNLSVQGNVNKNVIALQQEYPSMDICCYAASVPDAEVRRSVVSQLKEQLTGMNEAQAANALLHFVQSAFEYKTDGQQFGEGVEKSFFFDETLYFPYCDCEDRSIFYAYLVREILGLDVLLVGYPGHECTAVALSAPPQTYTSFNYKGRTYYICDPTYIGADIGMCMPDYRDEQPEVEEWY